MQLKKQTFETFSFNLIYIKILSCYLLFNEFRIRRDYGYDLLNQIISLFLMWKKEIKRKKKAVELYVYFNSPDGFKLKLYL